MNEYYFTGVKDAQNGFYDPYIGHKEDYDNGYWSILPYGKLPKVISTVEVVPVETFHYINMPIKLPGQSAPRFEKRLDCFKILIGKVCCDYISKGLDNYINSYVYITAKNLYQKKGMGFNREGWHSDSFMSDDTNYLWSNCQATEFANQQFYLNLDDKISLQQMEEQFNGKIVTYPNNSILRLDEFSIHRVGPIVEGIRCFVKITFSKKKFNLAGNSHNYELDYKWEMHKRQEYRNIPYRDEV
jgi:hypothetical protein